MVVTKNPSVRHMIVWNSFNGWAEQCSVQSGQAFQVEATVVAGEGKCQLGGGNCGKMK